MNTQIEALFTTALGLQPPWQVAKVGLNTGKRRIDFEVGHTGKRAACPACGVENQLIHDRVRRSWRHLDFFQFEAWLHADVPRVQCSGCGKTTQLPVPWAREGSGFTLLFEALALSLCRELPVQQAANLIRVSAKRIWRRIQHYVTAARAQDDMTAVRHIGVDETSVKRGHAYITVVHDLETKRLLFACAGRDHQTLGSFADDLHRRGVHRRGVRSFLAQACTGAGSGLSLCLSLGSPVASAHGVHRRGVRSFLVPLLGLPGSVGSWRDRGHHGAMRATWSDAVLH